ncbi:hypothetical protein ITI46_07745 [Streptomyces oryzae]|uniref:Uncharacterized protein n=1 Tax=Streptomyces oryzae TaxID=1434886 RepID=A0ABS3X879_9ACTN|nr:hypothetical protein [Streptomyces oryzae]MBO8191585.1 hypothetical protein [Streptomyces oryzae]
MERIGAIEARLERAEHELCSNSGGSLWDAVELANQRWARRCPQEAGEATETPDETPGEPPPALAPRGP